MVAENGCRYGLAFGIVDLGDRLRHFAQELRIVELMAAIGLAVECELPIAEG